MSVPVGLRKSSKFNLTNKIEEFLEYTYRIGSNSDVVPKRHKCTIGKNLIDNTLQLYELVQNANSIRVELKSDYKKRRKYQEEALGKLNVIYAITKALINISSLRKSTRDMLISQVFEISDILIGWMTMDEKFYSNIK